MRLGRCFGSKPKFPDWSICRILPYGRSGKISMRRAQTAWHSVHHSGHLFATCGARVVCVRVAAKNWRNSVAATKKELTLPNVLPVVA